jgi:predicted dehydrogenase
MSDTRVGVIGVGRIGSQHARILSSLDGTELTGVYDISPERGDEVAVRHGTRHFPSGEELLAAVDAVVIAVPTSSHYAVGLTALEAGCHMLIEKPLASTLLEADQLVDLAASRQLLLGVGHIERFNAAIRASEPYLDNPRFIESLRLAPFQPRGTDVTVVLDLMIHDIDLVLGLVRCPVEEVQAVGVSVLTETTDIANARLEFSNGAVADITASRVADHTIRRLRLFQHSGFISLDLAKREGSYQKARTNGAFGDMELDEEARLGDVLESVPLSGDDQEPLRLELEGFLRAIHGDGSGCVTGRDGRAALEVAERISRAVEGIADVPVETA